MTAAGLFPEPERVDIPAELAGWSLDQLEAALRSSVAVDDWEAPHRVLVALLRLPAFELGYFPLVPAVSALLEVHEPSRLYRPCGHFHEEDEDGRAPEGALWIEGLEDWVCESGYTGTTVCLGCRVDEDGECLQAPWPCSAFRPVATALVEALGVQP